MHVEALLVYLALQNFIVSGEILIVNTGDNIILSCNFSEQAEEMRWYFGNNIICDKNRNISLYGVECQFREASKVKILNIQKNLAGEYRFAYGKATMPLETTCEYEVTVGDLECRSSIQDNIPLIGESDSPMEPDIVNRSCAFRYSAESNISFQFAWMKYHPLKNIWRDKVLIYSDSSVTKEGSETIVRAEDQMQVSREMDGVIYECYLKEINDIKPCSLPKISVQSVKNISQKSDPVYSSDIRSISCAVNKTLAIGCTYSWTIRKGNIVWKLEGIQNLTRDHLTESGYYECIASCHFVTGGVYSFRGTHFDFVDYSVADGGFKVSTIILGVIVGLFVVIVVVGIFFISRCIKRRMQSPQTQELRSIKGLNRT